VTTIAAKLRIEERELEVGWAELAPRAELGLRSDRSHRIEMPLSGHTLERVLAPIVERDSGACNKILDRSGNEDFVGLGKQCDSRTDVNGDPADLVVHELALPGVKPYAFGDGRRVTRAVELGLAELGQRPLNDGEIAAQLCVVHAGIVACEEAGRRDET